MTPHLCETSNTVCYWGDPVAHECNGGDGLPLTWYVLSCGTEHETRECCAECCGGADCGDDCQFDTGALDD